MIRINLLKPEPGSPGLRPRAESRWISRRELWVAVVLLGAGMALLFYMATHTPRRAQQPHTALQPPTPPQPSPAPMPPESAPPSQPALAQSRDREGAEPSPPQQPAPPAKFTARATDLSIERQSETLIITLRLTGSVQYESTKMDTPNRLVVDISNCELALPPGQLRQPVDHPEVKRVRAAQFQIDPPTCRVVLDVAGFPRYQIQADATRLEIRIPGGGQ